MKIWKLEPCSLFLFNWPLSDDRMSACACKDGKTTPESGILVSGYFSTRGLRKALNSQYRVYIVLDYPDDPPGVCLDHKRLQMEFWAITLTIILIINHNVNTIYTVYYTVFTLRLIILMILRAIAQSSLCQRFRTKQSPGDRAKHWTVQYSLYIAFDYPDDPQIDRLKIEMEIWAITLRIIWIIAVDYPEDPADDHPDLAL